MSVVRPRNAFEGMLYRALMRLSHRFNWHYAPIIGPVMSKPGDWRSGKRQRWCQWCGMRDWLVEEPYGAVWRCEPISRHTTES